MQVNLELVGPNCKVMRLTHDNGRIIAEILVHGPLEAVIENCNSNTKIQNGRPNIYRGEAYGLAGYQLLDIEREEIIEK
jgi:hypothetical protein